VVIIGALKKQSKHKKSWNSDQDLIRQFRELPSTILKESNGTASAKSMNALVAEALSELKIGGGSKPENEIASNWSKIVGSRFSRKCAPEKLTDDGCLLVQVAGSAAKQELIFRKREILLSIQKLPKCGFLRDIRFV
tara:strand:- start:213 stop:623 length:411 start_codon:yes stop_codon:yes gene_type:complete